MTFHIILSYHWHSYIQNKLALQAGGETIDSLKTQLAEAQEKIDTLEIENAQLKGGDVPVQEDALEPEKPPETEVPEAPPTDDDKPE